MNAIGGEVKPKWALENEEVPLPNERKEVVEVIRMALAKGGVQKIVLEVGEPIRIRRVVRSDHASAKEYEGLVDEDIINGVRNAPIVQVDPSTSESLSPMQAVFLAFDEIRKKNAKPRAFLVNKAIDLCHWLGITPIDRVFDVSIKTSPVLPDEVALLVGCSSEDREDIVVSMKMIMESKPETK